MVPKMFSCTVRRKWRYGGSRTKLWQEGDAVRSFQTAMWKEIEATDQKPAALRVLRRLQGIACAVLLLIGLGAGTARAQTAGSPPPAPGNASQAPDATGAVHPTLLHSANPSYTKEARKKRINSTCTLSVVVDAAGMPQDITVVTSAAEGVAPDLHDVAAGLDAQAIKALRQYRFRPAIKDGVPIACKVRVVVNFKVI